MINITKQSLSCMSIIEQNKSSFKLFGQFTKQSNDIKCEKVGKDKNFKSGKFKRLRKKSLAIVQLDKQK